MTIGESIRIARVAKRMSQQNLSDATGVSMPVICRIERGADASMRILKKLCEQLDLEIVAKFKE